MTTSIALPPVATGLRAEDVLAAIGRELNDLCQRRERSRDRHDTGAATKEEHTSEKTADNSPEVNRQIGEWACGYLAKYGEILSQKPNSDEISLGSSFVGIEGWERNYYVFLPVGCPVMTFLVNGNEVMVITESCDLGKAVVGKKTGEKFTYNGSGSMTIQSILG